MAKERRKQVKPEKKKPKGKLAQKRARRLEVAVPSERALLEQGCRLPIADTWVSAGWDHSDPQLVTQVVARERPDGRFIVGSALVDRTCLGVKNGWLDGPMITDDLGDLLVSLEQVHGGVERCDPLLAQSILYNAIEYAASLGFRPHRDAPIALFGPRPEKLLDTPHARPAKPLYVAGPRDDMKYVLRKLEDAVGIQGFDCLMTATGALRELLEGPTERIKISDLVAARDDGDDELLDE
jgi:hypothetical protein